MRAKSFTASGLIEGIRVRVGGVNVAAGGAAAVVNFRDGLTASDEIILQVKVAANDSKAIAFSTFCPFDTALYAEVVSGTVQCSVWYE